MVKIINKIVIRPFDYIYEQILKLNKKKQIDS